jgi:hypothetical protein
MKIHFNKKQFAKLSWWEKFTVYVFAYTFHFVMWITGRSQNLNEDSTAVESSKKN